MSQLIRCVVTTPYRGGGCNCPVRWHAGRWVHAPEMETGMGEPLDSPIPEVIEFHRIHVGIKTRTFDEAARNTTRGDGLPDKVYTCLHNPNVSDDVSAFLQRALDDRPSDLNLVVTGRWIKRQREPLPERAKPTQDDAVEMALRSLERNGIARDRVTLTVAPGGD